MSSNIPFTTERLEQNEVRLNIDVAISRELHGSSFNCEATNMLPSQNSITKTTNIIFTITLYEESKSYNTIKLKCRFYHSVIIM